jgi:hypothetical protein
VLGANRGIDPAYIGECIRLYNHFGYTGALDAVRGGTAGRALLRIGQP